jgi:uncharacterized membrane protein
MTAALTGLDSARTSRWLMPLLVGSLAFNLLVIGAAGALLWRGVGPPEPPLGRRVVPSVLGYAVTLPPERVKELEQVTRAEWQKVRPLRRVLVEARQEFAQTISAEPFDPERFKAVQARLIAADRASRDAAFELHAAIALSLTPAERRGYLHWREQQKMPRNPLDVPEAPPAAASGPYQR